MHAVARRGTAGALLVLVRLPAGERAAGVEQAAVQALLALDRLGVEPSRFELPGQLAGLLRERSRRGARTLRLQARELVRKGPLPRRQCAELLQHRLAAWTDHREQTSRLPVQRPLVASKPSELLDGLGEPAARLRARDLAAAARQRERRGIQGVHRFFGKPGGLARVRVGFLELLPRRGHLPPREAERRLELRRDEGVLPRGLPDLTLHRRRAFLDGRLRGPWLRRRLATPQRLGHPLLPLGERRRLRQRPIERGERLPLPRAAEGVPPRAQLLGKPLELPLRLLTGLFRAGRLALLRRLGGVPHRALRPARRVLGRRQSARLALGRRPLRHDVPRDLLNPLGQRAGTLGERTLPRGRRAVGAHRLRSVPLVLAPLQLLGVRGERRERAFGRGAAEELPAALQLGLELLLRLGEALQRLPRGLGIEFRERLLQLPQALLQLGRHGASEQLLHLA